MNKPCLVITNLKKLVAARRASRLAMSAAKRKSAAPADAPKALDPIDQPKDEAPAPEAPAEETPAPIADTLTEASEPAAKPVEEAPVEEAVEQPEEPVAEAVEETTEAVEAPKKKKSYYRSKKKS